MREERNPSPDLGLGTTVLAGMGGTVLLTVLFLLFSWNGSRVAEDTSGARRTVSDSTRPTPSFGGAQ